MEEEKIQTQEPEEELINPENPHALYTDGGISGPPGTKWERWRHLAFRWKGLIYAILLGSIVLVIVASIKTDRSSFQTMIEKYFAYQGNGDLNGDWSYTVENHVFDQSTLNARYPVLARYTYGATGSRGIIDNKEYFGQFIQDEYETDMLVYAAMAQGVYADPEAKVILERALRKAAAEYYIYTRIRTLMPDLRTDATREEAVEFYEKNRDQFRSETKEAALEKIARAITETRRQALQQNLAIARRTVLEETRKQIASRVRTQQNQNRSEQSKAVEGGR